MCDRRRVAAEVVPFLGDWRGVATEAAAVVSDRRRSALYVDEATHSAARSKLTRRRISAL